MEDINRMMAPQACSERGSFIRQQHCILALTDVFVVDFPIASDTQAVF